MEPISKLENLTFDNSALHLPLDQIQENKVRTVPNSIFSRVKPSPISSPKLVAYSQDALRLIDVLNFDQHNLDLLTLFFSGNKLLPGSDPAAHCYCGHQFGYFSGQLGDGRAMYLGEVINLAGERWELQLKGAGPTPYSRQADGRAVLRSSIREFLCSEAMYYLGIPTTRAGTLVTSSTEVIRDLKYDGNPKREKCSVVLRIAPTFLRFGSFEICLPPTKCTGRSGPSAGNLNILVELLDYTIKTHSPHLLLTSPPPPQTLYLSWYTQVVSQTAHMVALWQCVGFTHGVLNTDNMSILGLTIDYGPFGFLDAYDPEFISNGSDHDGRYCFGKQPEICRWNCQKLAEALQMIIPLSLTEPIYTKYYWEIYEKSFLTKMRQKLGLVQEQENDKKLIENLLQIMEDTGADMTNTFRCLSKIDVTLKSSIQPVLEYILSQVLSVHEWASKCKPEVSEQELLKYVSVVQQSPMLLPYLTGRSPDWLIQQLQKKKDHDNILATSDAQKFDKDKALWENWLDCYYERLLTQVKDQSPEEIQKSQSSRVSLMNKNNPKFVLRNYLAQDAIEDAEIGNFEEVQNLLKLLQDPYGEGPEFSFGKGYDKKPPEDALDICVTCSS